MWRRIVSTFLLTALTSAQNVEPVGQKTDKGEPAVAVFAKNQNRLIPRGKETRLAIVVYRQGDRAGCCPYTANPDQTNLVPISLTLNNVDGLTLLHKQGRRYRTYVAGSSIQLGAGSKVLLMKARASENMRLGPVLLEGTLRFRDGSLERQLPIAVPLTVTGEKIKVSEWEWPFETHHGRTIGRIFTAILLAPVYLPIIILVAIVLSGIAGE
jgi:hypothetical protein